MSEMVPLRGDRSWLVVVAIALAGLLILGLLGAWAYRYWGQQRALQFTPTAVVPATETAVAVALATPTPLPSPTATPTALPTATPLPSPTATLTPLPPTATPTPTTTPTPAGEETIPPTGFGLGAILVGLALAVLLLLARWLRVRWAADSGRR